MCTIVKFGLPLTKIPPCSSLLDAETPDRCLFGRGDPWSLLVCTRRPLVVACLDDISPTTSYQIVTGKNKINHIYIHTTAWVKLWRGNRINILKKNSSIKSSIVVPFYVSVRLRSAPDQSFYLNNKDWNNQRSYRSNSPVHRTNSLI